MNPKDLDEKIEDILGMIHPAFYECENKKFWEAKMGITISEIKTLILTAKQEVAREMIEEAERLAYKASVEDYCPEYVAKELRQKYLGENNDKSRS